jgi:alginate O-acetyltransferase complex protein AlgI
VCIIIVFLISALWHGTTLPFIIWGMVHATCIILEKSKIVATFARTKVYSLIVICVVSMLWQTFRFHDINSLYLGYSRLFVPSDIDVELISVFVVSIILMFVAESKKIERLIMSVTNFTFKEKVLEVVLISTLILSLLFLCSDVSSQFFYFKY